MLHVVQQGSSPRRPLVLLFLIGPMVYEALREALGPEPCIVVDDASNGPETLGELTAWVQRNAGGFNIDGLVIGGFSAGCERVRALLCAGAVEGLRAVVCADGTHASLPPAQWQIDVWRTLADRAKRGEVVFAASHTYNVYTETIEPPAIPFLCTVHVLREATGFPLERDKATPAGTLSSEGQLAVYSFPSADCDAAAHGHQETVALPMLLRQHVRPLFEGAAGLAGGVMPDADAPRASVPPPTVPQPRAGSSTPITSRDLRLQMDGADVIAWRRWLDLHGFLGMGPVELSGTFDQATLEATRRMQRAIGLQPDGVVGPATRAQAGAWPAPPVKTPEGAPTWQASVLSLGAQAVRWALQFAGRDDLERDGPNASPEIAAWLAPAVRRATGELLHLAGGEWCAAFFCASAAAVLQAENMPATAVPHGYRAAGIELVEDAKADGAWKDASAARTGDWSPDEGDGCILKRGMSDWETHTCRVVTLGQEAGSFWTVGGNEDNTVRLTHRRFSDPDLLGFIAYSLTA